MGLPSDSHRPLRSGIEIRGGRLSHTRLEQTGRGTFTGLARERGTRTKVLVTNLHVLSGVDQFNSHKELAGDEEMYQSALPAEDRIPDCLEGVPVSVVEEPLPELPSISGSHPRPLLSGTKI